MSCGGARPPLDGRAVAQASGTACGRSSPLSVGPWSAAVPPSHSSFSGFARIGCACVGGLRGCAVAQSLLMSLSSVDALFTAVPHGPEEVGASGGAGGFGRFWAAVCQCLSARSGVVSADALPDPKSCPWTRRRFPHHQKHESAAYRGVSMHILPVGSPPPSSADKFGPSPDQSSPSQTQVTGFLSTRPLHIQDFRRGFFGFPDNP